MEYDSKGYLKKACEDSRCTMGRENRKCWCVVDVNSHQRTEYEKTAGENNVRKTVRGNEECLRMNREYMYQKMRCENEACPKTLGGHDLHKTVHENRRYLNVECVSNHR